MKIKTLEDLLAESAFFKDLDPPYRNMLAGCGANVVFRAGEYVFREGEESHQFYLLRAGKVSLEINVPGKGAMIIQTVQEGEVLGWSWIVPPYRKQYDARAVELTRAIVFDGACIRAKCHEDPRLGYEFFKRFAIVIAQRLSALRLQLLDLYAKP
jgi:CRP-like cAMP-binding protein